MSFFGLSLPDSVCLQNKTERANRSIDQWCARLGDNLEGLSVRPQSHRNWTRRPRRRNEKPSRTFFKRNPEAAS